MNLIPPEHMGDGLYIIDKGHSVAIAVNDHRNEVAYLEVDNIDKTIEYLQKVKERMNNGN